MDRIRIADIAQQLGLSVATVSNVLNGKHHKISKETEKRVLKAVEEAGYLPARAEVLMGRNPRRLVGFVINDHPTYEGHPFSDPYLQESLAALIDESSRHDLDIVPRSASTWNEVADFASTWNMKGLILSGFCQADYEKLDAMLHIPLVVYNAVADGFSCISNDDFEGGKLLGQHLYSLGHRSVTCFVFAKEAPDLDRVLGLQAAGLTTHIYEVPATKHERLPYYSSVDVADDTVVFCASDMLALEYMHRPDFDSRLSVCGFDGIAAARYSQPVLTTIRQDHQSQARAAFACLESGPLSMKICGQLEKGDSVHEV